MPVALILSILASLSVGWVAGRHYARTRRNHVRSPESATDRTLTVGLPDEWHAFADRNRQFFDRFDNTREVLNALFDREWSSEEPVDRVVFAAGYLAVDDFLEILLVCGNGEAPAAQKLLRPMFERVVTLQYLAKHPEEVDSYLDYYWVTQRKLANAIETTFQPGLLNANDVEEVKQHYDEVKGKYQVTDCEKCGTTRVNVAWTPKDVITMAKDVGMKDFVVPAYYIPMQFTHPSVKAMLGRMTITDDGFTFTPRIDSVNADKVFCAAHALLLHAVAVQVDHFKLDEALWKRVEQDFLATWKRDRVGPPTAP